MRGRFLVVRGSLHWCILVCLFLRCTSQQHGTIIHSWNHPTWCWVEPLGNQWWERKRFGPLTRPPSSLMLNYQGWFQWSQPWRPSKKLDSCLIKKNREPKIMLWYHVKCNLFFIINSIKQSIRYRDTRNYFWKLFFVYTIFTTTIMFDPWVKGFLNLRFP